MTAHGENIGSRKVEPEMQNLMEALEAMQEQPLGKAALRVAKSSSRIKLETHPQPLWRLKANYLLRQLVRIWYGKLPIRDYPNSPEFERLFLGIMCQFVEDHGFNGKQVPKWIERQKEKFESVHGRPITFRDRDSELHWIIRSGIPKELHEIFAKDETIQLITVMAAFILEYEKEEKEPPYEPIGWMQPLDYYEALPVLEPEPEWRLIANGLLQDLARVWYGEIKSLPKDFEERLGHLLVAFAIDNGMGRTEFMEKAEAARADFEELHGCELTFRNIVQGIVWTARKCLPEKLADEFLWDAEVRFILTATELILALIKAGLEPPYKKYAISFETLDEYEELPVLTKERQF